MNKRQDAWSEEDDLVLTNTVIDYIKNGKTQLAAFEEVGNLLKRTAAAVGFRWNSALRQKNKSRIQEAKNIRVKGNHLSHIENLQTPVADTDDQVSLAEVLNFITHLAKQVEKSSSKTNPRQGQTQEQKKQITIYEKQIRHLKGELTALSKNYKQLQSDYDEVIAVFKKANILSENESNEPSLA